jgi:hypothetical protein
MTYPPEGTKERILEALRSQAEKRREDSSRLLDLAEHLRTGRLVICDPPSPPALNEAQMQTLADFVARHYEKENRRLEEENATLRATLAKPVAWP